MDHWANILDKSPLIAMVLALAAVVVYLYRSREKLQAEMALMQVRHTEDLVKATSALQALTSEHLKRSFEASEAWRGKLDSVERTLSSHMDEERTHDERLLEAVSSLRGNVERVLVILQERVVAR